MDSGLIAVAAPVHVDSHWLTHSDAFSGPRAGLGKCDKFFFFISSHGSKNGAVRIGTDRVPWDEICRLLAENVQAEFINCVFATCYAGTAIAEFVPWISQTTSGIRVVTTTDSGHPSYSAGNGSECNLECVVAQLEELLAASAGQAPPTLEQIEDAFAALNVSKEDIDKKLCDFVEMQKAANPNNVATLDNFKNDYKSDDGPGDPVPPTGTPATGGFPPADPNPAPVPPLAPLLPLMPGMGTTNDGGGTFTLPDGTLTFGDAGQTVKLTGMMQITNIGGHGPGSYTLCGTITSDLDAPMVVCSATGTMQVFPGAQVEDLTGTITLDFQSPTLMVDFEGTHTEGQRAAFEWAAALAPRGNRDGDFDGDGDVDLFDLQVFVECFTGPSAADDPVRGFCAIGDFDDDGDLDEDDLAAFVSVLSGP